MLSGSSITYYSTAEMERAGKAKVGKLAQSQSVADRSQGEIMLTNQTTLNFVQGGVAYRKANAHKADAAAPSEELAKTLDPKPNLLEISDASDKNGVQRTYYLSFSTESQRNEFARVIASNLAAVRATS